MSCADAVRQNLLLNYPRPDYPRDPLRRRATGAGVFLLRFDYESGRLREIRVGISTGSPTLDAASIQSLKQWQAKPRSLHIITVPIAFATIPSR